MKSSGVLLIDKPAELSSAAAIAKVKHHFSLPKIGHGGTLDPFATGLLVVLVGEATKIARFLLSGEKTYEATAIQGFETDTEDLTGKKLSNISAPLLSRENLEKVRSSFLGKINQRPPAYSALKVQGKPLYAYARKGQSVEIKERTVEIQSLELLGCSLEEFSFRVTCGGGTYIRSLTRDWARKAGGKAHLLALRRLHANGFSLEQAHSLSSLLELTPEELPLIPITESLPHIEKFFCSSEIIQLIRQGNPRVLQVIAKEGKNASPYILAVNSENRMEPIAILSTAPSGELSFERVFDPHSPST